MNKPILKPHTPRLCGAVAGMVLALSATSSLSAQEEEYYELDPFTVTNENARGYLETNSLTGTRTNTPISEIPYNIQVLNAALGEDFQLTSHVDFERYNAALVNGGDDPHSNNVIQQQFGQFIFRGFVQNWSLRDGVRQYDPVDAQGLERIEIVKGPAASLYGLSYPGGLLNSISKTVNYDRTFADFTFTLEDEGGYRATIDGNVTSELENGGVVAARYNGVDATTKDGRDNSKGSIEYQQLNLGWKPQPATKVEFLYETGFKEHPSGLGYFETGGLSDEYGEGSSVPLQIVHENIGWDQNWAAPGNMRNIDTEHMRLDVSHNFSDNFSVTAYWQAQERVQVDSDGLNASGQGGSAANWDLGWYSGGGTNIATGWMLGDVDDLSDDTIVMQWHHRDWQNDTDAYGFTGVYELDTSENFSHLFTFGHHRWQESFRSRKSTMAQNADDSSVAFALDSDIVTLSNISSNPQFPGVFGRPSSVFDDGVGGFVQSEESSNYYSFLSWQMTTLDDRLRTTVSYNDTSFELITYSNGASNQTEPTNITKDSDTSLMLGVSFDVTEDITLFALDSSSLFPNTTKDDFEQPLDPIIGESLEFGVKFNLIDSKLTGTISIYEIEQEGSGRDLNAINRAHARWNALVAANDYDTIVSEFDEVNTVAEAMAYDPFDLNDRNGQPGDLVNGVITTSEGFEIDLVYQPNTNWQLMFSYAHNETEVTSHPDPTQEGAKTVGAIEDQFALVTKYSFDDDSSLAGLSLGLGAQVSDGKYQGGDRYDPSTDFLEVFADYKFQLFEKDSFVRLNIKNLTEQDEFVGWYAENGTGTANKRFTVPTDIRFDVTFGMSF